MPLGLLGWAIVLWQDGAATTGAVILVCTLGLSVLHATRDHEILGARHHALGGEVHGLL